MTSAGGLVRAEAVPRQGRPPLRPRRRRGRRGARRPALRLRAGDRLRHGRHQHRRRPLGRRLRVPLRAPGGGRPPRGAGPRHRERGGGRRLDLRLRRHPAQGGAGERRRLARPGLLRRRRAADADRRQPASSAGSTPSASRSPSTPAAAGRALDALRGGDGRGRSRPRGRARRAARDRRRADGGGDPLDLAAPGLRSGRPRPGRLRRRRRPARLRRGRAAGDRERPGAGGRRAALGARAWAPRSSSASPSGRCWSRWRECGERLAGWLAELGREAAAAVAAEGIAPEEIAVRRRLLNLRFAGQEATLAVEYEEGRRDRAGLRRRLPGDLRLRSGGAGDRAGVHPRRRLLPRRRADGDGPGASGSSPAAAVPAEPAAAGPAAPGGRSPSSTARRLAPGATFAGPSPWSSRRTAPRWWGRAGSGRVDAAGNLVLERGS